jgi:hypothetical protein
MEFSAIFIIMAVASLVGVVIGVVWTVKAVLGPELKAASRAGNRPAGISPSH